MDGLKQLVNVIKRNMEIETINKVYGIYAWNRITTLFKTKEEVEKYLELSKNIISCYNPNRDYWTTDHFFTIVPVDKNVMKDLGIRFYFEEDPDANL